MARDLQERIKKLSIERRLPSGAVLPTEPELMTLLGAGRNSVREALKALQAMGIVEIRHGFGTHVGPRSLALMVEGLAAARGAGLAEADRAFHATLYRGLENVLLGEALEAFWDAFHRVRTDLAEVLRDPKVTCRQHREIVDAVRSGDSVRAEAAIRHHFLNIRTRATSTAP
ncbi:FadR/GntR family transcriptional regulator [Streptomyces chiangmaiensis]|uniref:FCD domain-containing protein n=1 Tax=Streptomyces chiangmaiensis TaxID=766497 RepID=A0ABU7FM74_9ACTN|nr:FCD domain-containing protein [Streptomyces chiangmaiensis]MED7824782.1 FCD domain-containing protein [Streptomyces chiangmaiensis]